MIELKSGQSLKETVDSIILDVRTLPVNEDAHKYMLALQVFENRWVADGHVAVSQEMEARMKEATCVDKRTGLQLADTAFIKNTGAKISPFFAMWVSLVAKNKDWYMAMIGAFSYYFYETHNRDEWVTLAWFNDYVAVGAELSSAFGFRMARDLSVNPPIPCENSEQRHLVFDYITEEEFFNV